MSTKVAAISPRDDNIIYTILTDADPFAIDSVSGELYLDANSSNDWPIYDPINSDNNIFYLSIKADDGTDIAQMTLTITITDVFNLTATVETKTLHFRWDPLRDSSNDNRPADYYKLFLNPDGKSGFSVIQGGDYIQATEFIHNIGATLINPTDWLNARYQLFAYRKFDSTDASTDKDTEIASSTLFSVAKLLFKAIGYVKSPDIKAGDEFGNNIQFSEDGDTLIVGITNTTVPNPANSLELLTAAGMVTIHQRKQDGSWSHPGQTLTAEVPGTDDRFGYDLALSKDGKTLVVGASFADIPDSKNIGQTIIDAGTVTVFDRNVDGTWPTVGQTLTATNPGASDTFGQDIAIANDGQLLVVGARSADITNPNNPAEILVDAGHVTIFSRSPNGSWIDNIQTITAVNPEKLDYFSEKIVLSNDSRTIVVGARSANVSDPNNPGQPFYDAGNVKVFTLSSNGSWTDNTVTLTAVNPGSIDWFSWDFALSNDARTLVVGAPRADSPDPNNPGQSVHNGGTVTVFNLAPNGLWTDNVKILSSVNPKLDDFFGRHLVLSSDGKTLAVSAPFAISLAQNTRGNTLVHGGTTTIFELSPSGSWTEKITTLTAQNPGEDDVFGGSLSLTHDGKTLAVGATFADISDPSNLGLTQVDVGSVTVFSRSPNGSWFDSIKTIKAPNPRPGDVFGSSVFLSADGRSLVVGAPKEDSAIIGVNGIQGADCYNPDGTQNDTPVNCAINSGTVYIY